MKILMILSLMSFSLLVTACQKEVVDPAVAVCNPNRNIDALLAQNDYDLLNDPAPPAVRFAQPSYTKITAGFCELWEYKASGSFSVHKGTTASQYDELISTSTEAANVFRRAIRTCQCGI